MARKPIRNQKITEWLHLSSVTEKEYVAARANTTIPYLYVLSSGRRIAGYALGKQLAQAFAEVNIERGGDKLPLLPFVLISDICTNLDL